MFTINVTNSEGTKMLYNTFGGLLEVRTKATTFKQRIKWLFTGKH